ncbi:MAG: tetratricopeptide repeat protein [Spirochaetaceae bacterium]|nr:tetratricopeptide repeat protein [Spirochaetaceae bacterium]
MDISSILIAVLIILVFLVIITSITGKKSKAQNGSKTRKRSVIIKDATKKLSQNPHNVPALTELSNLYYQEHNWEKALPLLEELLKLTSTNKDIDYFQVALRQGITALNMKKPEDAMKGLSSAIKINNNNFEANYYLGQAFYQANTYDKAIPYLRKASTFGQEAPGLNEAIGLSFYNMKRYRDSLPYLKRALEENPDGKVVLFSMADAMQQTGFGDKALKVFMHLRADPEFGARSCLAAGIMHMNGGTLDKAIQDFEIALRHVNIPQDTLLEIKYRLAGCYLQSGSVDLGLAMLREVQVINSSYRDVNSLITRYTELKQNKNLQIYLTAGNSDFVALCRKLVETFYGRAVVRILDISVTTDNTEVLTEVETAKWEDTVIFRFYRTSGTTGELHIRDFHGRIKDARAGHGICLTAGAFSEEAKKYIEGRPIDLVDKTELIKRLKKIDTM